MLNFDFLVKGQLLQHISFMIFLQKYSSCYVLFTDQI